MTTILRQPMPSVARPDWPGALWIGLLDDAPGVDQLTLSNADGYHHARLLVREAGLVRGFVELDLSGPAVDLAALERGLASLPVPDSAPVDTRFDPTTVVICTRDRPDQLYDALRSVLAVDHPQFEVVVVDNASRTRDTRRVVEEMAERSSVSIRCVAEPHPGLARARNTGIRHARGSIVAFTDDDVVVDRLWLRRTADGFARSADVGLVTGLVPSGEVRTPVQAYFEQRVTWASSCRARLFSLAEPPADVPLFPFRVGVYGTGANFAMRRSVAYEMGGFDEAFGVGSPTRGGEDVDMFVRVLVAGLDVAFEPSALIWHRHRSDLGALEQQAIGYGTGLSAWLTKVALDRELRPLALSRLGAGLRRARELAQPAAATSDSAVEASLREALRQVARAERRAFLGGPWRYTQSRRAGAERSPLSST